MQLIVERRDLRAEQRITVVDQRGIRSTQVTSLFKVIQDLSSPVTVQLKSGGPSVTFQANLTSDEIGKTFNTWLSGPYSFLTAFSGYSIEKVIVKRAALDERQKIVLKLKNPLVWNGPVKIAIIEGLTLREFLTQRQALFNSSSAKPVVIEKATSDDWNESQLVVDIPEDQPPEGDYSAIEDLFTDTLSSASAAQPSLTVVSDFLSVYPRSEGWVFRSIELSKSNRDEKQTIAVTFSKGGVTVPEKILNKTLRELRENCQIFFGVSEIREDQIVTPQPTRSPIPNPKKVAHLSNRKFFIAIPILLLPAVIALLYWKQDTIQAWLSKP